MKYSLFILALFVLTACGSNPNDKEPSDKDEKEIEWDREELENEFKHDLLEFVACLNHEDYECVADYIPEQMLRIVPKEILIAQMEQMNEMGMDMQFDEFQILKMSDVAFHDDHYYCKLNIKSSTKISLSGMMLLQKDMLLEAFTQKGVEPEEIDAETIGYSIEEEMYAIANEKTKTWKYVRLDQDMKSQLDQIIPVQVRTRFE
ncbi:MAG: hypothetical protein DCO96_11805 [Fluviicola sp. XM-24bin1]|nr:MAG: hypothetical protein DCO96_11805 [Fluviicola sp. XM-24bin1]